MVDIAAIAGVTSSLKAAGDITKTAIGLRDAAAMQSKIIELQGVILTAQGSAMSAQADYFTMIERVRDLEKEIADSKAWDAEKQKYILSEVSRGAFAFVMHETTNSREPPHWLCAACFQRSRKRVLQQGPRATGPQIRDTFKCSTCNETLIVQHGVSPSRPATTPDPQSPSGPPCPICTKSMKTVKVQPDRIFGDVGLQEHFYECSCGHSETRQVDPSKRT